MLTSTGAADLPKFIVDTFDNNDPTDERHRRRRFEFDSCDAAVHWARRFIDKSLRRTYNPARTAIQWYRYWSAFGDGVTAPGTGFDPRDYAKKQIQYLSVNKHTPRKKRA